MFFSTRESAVQGLSVSINEGNRTPEQRYQRAKTRVENLTRKLIRIQDGRHPKSRELDMVVAQTRFAIDEWEKRMKIAEFEMKVQRGDV